jgi:hypothetical protein
MQDHKDFFWKIQWVDKIMETLRNWGIEFVLAASTGRTSDDNIQCSSISIHSVMLISLISDYIKWQYMWKNWNTGDLSDFEREQTVGAHLAGTTVIKTDILLGILRQLPRLCWHAQIMGRQHLSKEERWVKINTDRKRTLYIEKDCFEKSQNNCSKTEYSSWRPCFHKNWCQLHKSNLHGRPAIAKPLITGSNAQMFKQWCHNHKTWTSVDWKQAHDIVRWVILHAVPYIKKSLCSENTRRCQEFGIPGSNSETQGRFYDDLGSNIVVQYSVGTIITLHGQITAREYVKG